MINTSMAYKKAIQKNREFSIRDKYVFADGSEPDMSTTNFMAYSINEATSESGKFSIGAAVIKKYTATLNNENDKFSGYNFEGCDISARVGLKLEDGTVEVLQKGRYRIVSAKASNMTISVEGYDSMLFFDRPYSESTLAYPATISEIVRDACTHCQVAYDISTLPWPDYTVRQKPSGGALTFRDVISYCAQIQCCYAKINNLDQLIFGWYDFDAFGDGNLNGGAFDAESENAYLSGDSADGGTFDDYSAGYSFDAGTFDDMSKYHHIFLLGSQSINTDDITITGVRVSAVLDNSDQTESYVCGTDGYMLSIEENPLIQSGQAQSVAEYIGSKMIGRTFRPMSITCQSDPCMEAGDGAIVTDRKQNSYQTVITNTTFAIGAMQQITCDAETPTEKNYTKYGASTKLLDKSRKETQKQLTAYDLAASQLGALMAHSMGMYETREVDPDTGAEIKYMHDKPSLEESETIWKQTVDAFAVSTDGGESWNAGIDASGNVLAKVLSVIGLNADWINAGVLTGRKINNGQGTFLVDENGKVTANDIAITGGTVNIVSNSEGASVIALESTWFESSIEISPRMILMENNAVNNSTIYAYSDFITLTNGSSGSSAQFNSRGFISSNENVEYVMRGTNPSIKATYVSGKTMEFSFQSDYIIRTASERLIHDGDFYCNGDGEFSGNLQCDGIASGGIKSRIVKTDNFGIRHQYCYEMPSPLFGDIGSGVLDANGRCYVDIDPIFRETVSDGKYHVFLQKEGEGDLWVDLKESAFFVVKGTPNLAFSWEVKVKQKGYETERLENFDPEAGKISDIDYAEQSASMVKKNIERMEKEAWAILKN